MDEIGWAFLRQYSDKGESTESFVVDPGCEKFQMTFNPGGYLRRIEGPGASPG